MSRNPLAFYLFPVVLLAVCIVTIISTLPILARAAQRTTVQSGAIQTGNLQAIEPMCGQFRLVRVQGEQGMVPIFIPRGNTSTFGIIQSSSSPPLVDGQYYRIKNPSIDYGSPMNICVDNIGCWGFWININMAHTFSDWEPITVSEVCGSPNPTQSSPPISPQNTPRVVSINFSADPESVQPGGCTTLRWDVDNVNAVYLNGQGVTGHGMRQICPSATETHALRVATDNGDVTRTLTVTVITSPLTPNPGPSCSSGQARITAPTSGQVLHGTVPVYGSAICDSFAYYKFEFVDSRCDPTGLCFAAGKFTQPVNNGLLMNWDTTKTSDGQPLPNGTYTLRLTVVGVDNPNGNVLPQVSDITITVDNSISAPPAPVPTTAPTAIATLPPTPQSQDTSTPVSPTQSTLCGQVKLVTSASSPTTFPVLRACGSTQVYMWPAQSFRKDVTYRILDPALRTIPARGSQEYGDITQAIASWAHIEEINSCEVCGTDAPVVPTPRVGPPNLQLAKVDVVGTPTAFEPFDLALLVRNSAFTRYVPTSGAYQVKVVLVEDFTYKHTVLLFDSDVTGSSQWLSVPRLPALDPGDEVTLSVNNLTLPATYQGSLEITLIPKDNDTNTSNKTLVFNFAVGTSDKSYLHCVGLAIKVIAPLLEGEMAVDPRMGPGFLEFEYRVRTRCLDSNEACVANEVNQYMGSVPEDLLLKVAKKTPAGLAIDLVKTSIEALLEGGKCTTWCWNYVRSLTGTLVKGVGRLGIVTVESSAGILVQSNSGQRTGFEDGGSIVQEIPVAAALSIGGDNIVIYPIESQPTIRIKGKTTEKVTIRLIRTDRDASTQQMVYQDIPVTTSTVGIIVDADPKLALAIDQDGDGKTISNIPPSIVGENGMPAQVPTVTPEPIARTSPATPTQVLSEPTSEASRGATGGICPNAILVGMLPILAAVVYGRRHQPRE